jgi:hypothetical protein
VSPENSTNDGDGSPSTLPANKESLFDLRLFFRELWRWKWLMLVLVILGAVKGISDARDFSPSYEAQMIVSPKEEGGFAVPAGRGAGLLNAAQSFGLIGAGGRQATPFDHFKQTLGSRALANALQAKHGLMQKIFAGSWDEASKTWIKPNVDENSIRWKIKRFFHYNFPRLPDIGNLANYIGGSVSVSNMENLPFFKISVVNSDPEFALYLLDVVYREADEFLGERDRRKQLKNKQYVEAQLEKVQLAEVRAALLSMLMQQEQRAMLINSEPPYTLKILESPWVTTQPKEPRLVRLIGVPIAVALLLSLAFATISASFRLE